MSLGELVSRRTGGPKDNITHAQIAAAALSEAASIVRSHPNHPTTTRDVLQASSCHVADRLQTYGRQIALIQFEDHEDRERDVVAEEEVKGRISLEKLNRAFAQPIVQLKATRSAVADSHPSVIAVEVEVLKLIAEQLNHIPVRL